MVKCEKCGEKGFRTVTKGVIYKCRNCGNPQPPIGDVKTSNAIVVPVDVMLESVPKEVV